MSTLGIFRNQRSINEVVEQNQFEDNELKLVDDNLGMTKKENRAKRGIK